MFSLWPFRKRVRKNRDLSELYEGELEITIEDVCTQTGVFDCDTLAAHVACVYLSVCDNYVFITDVRQSPWEVISFDRQARTLVVRRVQ